MRPEASGCPECHKPRPAPSRGAPSPFPPIPRPSGASGGHVGRHAGGGRPATPGPARRGLFVARRSIRTESHPCSTAERNRSRTSSAAVVSRNSGSAIVVAAGMVVAAPAGAMPGRSGAASSRDEAVSVAGGPGVAVRPRAARIPLISTTSDLTASSNRLAGSSSGVPIAPEIFPSRSTPLRRTSTSAGDRVRAPFWTSRKQSSMTWATRTAASTRTTRAAPLIECAARIISSTRDGSPGDRSRSSNAAPSTSEWVSTSIRKDSTNEKSSSPLSLVMMEALELPDVRLAEEATRPKGRMRSRNR